MIIIVTSACAPLLPESTGLTQAYHQVKIGENIESIAFQLQLSPAELRQANPWLDPANISPGMRLRIPGNSGHQGYDPTDSMNLAIDDEDELDKFIWPIDYVDISSPYGPRRGRLHAGIDLRAPGGTAIKASAAGRVKFSGYKRGFGNIVVINHGNGVETVYAHNRRNLVKARQRIRQGQTIATVGRSGNASGYHVHFEYRRRGRALNPKPLLGTP